MTSHFSANESSLNCSTISSLVMAEIYSDDLPVQAVSSSGVASSFILSVVPRAILKKIRQIETRSHGRGFVR